LTADVALFDAVLLSSRRSSSSLIFDAVLLAHIELNGAMEGYENSKIVSLRMIHDDILLRGTPDETPDIITAPFIHDVLWSSFFFYHQTQTT
jgi:hypothetical protein